MRILPCATWFIDHLDQALRQASQAQRLTRKQRYFLALVISAMILTQRLCWVPVSRILVAFQVATFLAALAYPGHIVFLRSRGFAQLPPCSNVKSIGYKSLGKYSSTALWWMFYRSEIVWYLLLRFRVFIIIDHCGLSEGNLSINDAKRLL